MPPLATARAIDLLKGTADMVGLDGRVEARFSAIQAIFGTELAYIDAELRAAAAGGEKPATEAALHLVRAGGKRVRPLTVLLSAACFGPVPEAARELAVVAELVHSATLLHDDVIDDSRERRGEQAARQVWVVGTSYDDAGHIVGVRRWEWENGLAPGGSLPFEFTISSIGGTIAQVEFAVEARP